MTPTRWTTLPTLFLLTVFCAAARADGADDEAPVKLTLHPAAEPRPALKYQLLPKFMDRIQGNAAVDYGKVTAEQTGFFGDFELLRKIERWQQAPLEQLRVEDKPLRLLGSVQYFLERAARCEYCDWQLPIREGEYYAILLPDAQQTRTFAKILSAKARMHVARGEFDEAVKTFQTGYAMGRHVAAGETLINGWVGVAICKLMSVQVMEFVQQPGAPNLYWGLTMLPRPLIDVREALEAEMNVVESSFPEVRDLNAATRTADEWRESLHRFWGKLVGWADLSGVKARPEAVVARSLRGYPMAKRALIDRGLSPEAVKSMPVTQVVMLYTMQTYQDLRDEVHKWCYVPYPEAVERRQALEDLCRRVEEECEILPVARVFLPAVWACHTAVVRTDREIALLRVIEALRMHGAAHQGRLPEKLADVQEAPIPVDPVTGKAFGYQLDGDTAYLQGPPLPGAPLNCEIKMAGK